MGREGLCLMAAREVVHDIMSVCMSLYASLLSFNER